MLVSTTKCMWWPWWAYSEVQWPYRAFASNTMTVSVVNKIRSTHQMQSPSVSSTKYGDVSWARYRCTIVYAYFLSGRLRVWCGGHIISSWGGHIISSCGGSTWGLMGRFHPAPHRLDLDALYEDPCGGLSVQDKATGVVEESIPTDDKSTIYDL